MQCGDIPPPPDYDSPADAWAEASAAFAGALHRLVGGTPAHAVADAGGGPVTPDADAAVAPPRDPSVSASRLAPLRHPGLPSHLALRVYTADAVYARV